mmetsp:Transcript_28064/g.82559  ORF Transcript_28064/g.82559 Transcript_28064/m.82559 type:complete len:270 (+) Transcript_28064:1505-2314(+)
MMGRAALFTASQSTPKSNDCHVRLVSPSFRGGAKQAPLLAARPRPGTVPKALSTFSCASPETTNTVLDGSAHRSARALMTAAGGLFPLEPRMSLLRYLPAGSLTTMVPLKSQMMTRRVVLRYARTTASVLRCVKLVSFSLARNAAVLSMGFLFSPDKQASTLASHTPGAASSLWSPSPPSDSTSTRATSFMSLRTFAAHCADGLVDTNSASRWRRPSRSFASMVSALSIALAVLCRSNGLILTAPFSMLHTAQNSDATTTPGLRGGFRA